jgi:hypothetical protein
VKDDEKIEDDWRLLKRHRFGLISRSIPFDVETIHAVPILGSDRRESSDHPGKSPNNILPVKLRIPSEHPTIS